MISEWWGEVEWREQGRFIDRKWLEKNGKIFPSIIIGKEKQDILSKWKLEFFIFFEQNANNNILVGTGQNVYGVPRLGSSTGGSSRRPKNEGECFFFR